MAPGRTRHRYRRSPCLSYEDGRRVWPKAPPDQLLADFRRQFRKSSCQTAPSNTLGPATAKHPIPAQVDCGQQAEEAQLIHAMTRLRTVHTCEAPKETAPASGHRLGPQVYTLVVPMLPAGTASERVTSKRASRSFLFRTARIARKRGRSLAGKGTRFRACISMQFVPDFTHQDFALLPGARTRRRPPNFNAGGVVL
ncbi:hypothetical protein ACVILL_007009 [Bradyrhizobium sp. USDA 3364]